MRIMRIKKKRNYYKILMMAAMLIFAAGMCACENKDGGESVLSDNTYDVLRVDSVEESGIDYDKYAITNVDGGGKDNTKDSYTIDDTGVSGADSKKNDGSNSDDVNNTNGSGKDNSVSNNNGSDKDNGVGNNNGSDKGNGSGNNNAGDKGNGVNNNRVSDKGSGSNNGGGKSNGSNEKIGDDKSSVGSKSENDIKNSGGNNNGGNGSSVAANSGVPEPSEQKEMVVDKSKVYICSLLIECKAVLSDIDKLDSNKLALIPEDGIILEKQDIEFFDGESAFDVLLRETRNEKIHMEYSFTPIYNSSYIEGIANLYEFDCGELSGWVYSVNDRSPGYGISRYSLKDGDVIHLEYTLERQ